MNSVTAKIDGCDIARQIKMERQVFGSKSMLLLEGDTDIRRFSRYVDGGACSVVNCFGKRNALKAVKLLSGERIAGVLAIIDADFDRIMGNVETCANIVYSETHDLDLDFARPTIVERYLVETTGDLRHKLDASAVNIVNKILAGLRPVSIMHLLNATGRVSCRGDYVEQIWHGAKFYVDVDLYVDLAAREKGGVAGTKEILRSELDRESAREYDLWQLTNGHEFCRALGACVRNVVGSRGRSVTHGAEVEKDLRLACNDAEFEAMPVYLAIRRWAQENAPFRVFRLHGERHKAGEVVL